MMTVEDIDRMGYVQDIEDYTDAYPLLLNENLTHVTYDDTLTYYVHDEIISETQEVS